MKTSLQSLQRYSQGKLCFTQYTVLEVHFRSVNYTFVTRICKNFEQKEPVCSGVQGKSSR